MDVFIRVINWSEKKGISAQKPYRSDKLLKEANDSINGTHAYLSFLGVSGYVLNKLEELGEYCRDNFKPNERIDAIADSMVYDMTELLKEGYSPQLVIEEVLKVVESRTGQWDEELGKFVKDVSPEAQARWYVPNYVSNCMLPKNRTGCLFTQGLEDEDDGRNS